MARLAAKKDPLSYTILINTDPNWHQHTNPFNTAYPDIHVITYIRPHTLQYHEPIKPTYDDDPYIEPLAIQILCIHHKTTTIGHLTSLQQLSTHVINQDILIQVAPATPHNTKVHYNKIWHALPNPPPRTHFTNTIIPFPNYTFVLPLKYPLNITIILMVHFFLPNKFHPTIGDQKWPLMVCLIP